MHPRFALKSRTVAILIVCAVTGGLFVLTLAAPGAQILDLRFNPYALLSAVTFLLNLGLLLYFVSKPARTDERIWLSLYLAALCVFAFGEMLQRLSATPQEALFWAIFSSVSDLFAPSLYLFTMAYTNQSERRFPGTTVILLIGAAIMLFFYGHTNAIFSTTLIKLYPWGYNALARPGISLALLWYDGLFVLSLLQLITFRRHTRNTILRKQSLLFIIAVLAPLVIGSLTDGVLPWLGITVLPPLALTLFSPAAILLIYGVLRYQLTTISPALFADTVLTTMQEPVVVTDEQFRVLYTNPEAEVLIGIGAGRTTSFSLLDLVAQEYLETVHQAVAGSAANGDAIRLDRVDLMASHKRSIPVRVRSSHLKRSGLDVWVNVLTDITAELQTRNTIEHEVRVRTRELHEARAYLVSSINSLEQGFVLVNHALQIEMLNDKAAELFSVSSGNGADKTLADVMQLVEWHTDVLKAVTGVLKSRRHKRIAVAASDGSFYEVYVTPVLTATDTVLGATIVIEDVTERKILERSKDEFFSIASHELRTPLTAIRGNMSMAKDCCAEAMKDPTLRELVEDTHSASVRLIEIVNDFLDSSKLEQGKMVFTFTPVAVAPLMTAIREDLSLLAAKQGDTIVFDHLESVPSVLADEARLRQIYYNLLSNAIKYVEHATITVSGVREGTKVRVRITDTGKGISLESQKLLFHKFQQAGESILTRDNTKGTGLGLYISRLLATHMHGAVELEHSEVGKGSTFAIVLPATDAPTHLSANS